MRAAAQFYFVRELFFFIGIFAPAFRASDRPIAMACLRFVTFLPDRPLFSVPRFISCMARLTFRLPLLLLAAMYSPHFAPWASNIIGAPAPRWP